MLPHLAIEERNADETTRGYEPKVSNGLESLSSIGVEEWTTLKLARCSTTMLSCFATFRTVDIASHDGENDWDRGRRTLRGDGRGSSDHDQNVGIVCYQRCRIFVEALVLLRREDLFEHEGSYLRHARDRGSPAVETDKIHLPLRHCGRAKEQPLLGGRLIFRAWQASSLDAMPIRRAVAGPKAVNPYFGHRY